MKIFEFIFFIIVGFVFRLKMDWWYVFNKWCFVVVMYFVICVLEYGLVLCIDIFIMVLMICFKNVVWVCIVGLFKMCNCFFNLL